MSLHDRSALILGLAQPYIDWATALDEDGIGPGEDDRRSVYLLPPYSDEEEARDLLERAFREIFERELFAWCEDESTWPAPRTLAMFLEWFDVELVSVVEDLVGGGPDDEDLGWEDDDGDEEYDDDDDAEDDGDDVIRH
jgi:hypothetical protein